LPGAKLNSRFMADPQGELQEVIRNPGLRVVMTRKRQKKKIIEKGFFASFAFFAD
jgi:hypothetical protein